MSHRPPRTSPLVAAAVVLLALVAGACGSTISSSESDLADDVAANAEGEIVTEDTAQALQPTEPASADGDEAGESGESADEATESADQLTPEAVNDALGRGINFGNSLEAPREGDWGIGLDASYFTSVAEAGFTHVRLPVSWANYAADDPPYLIPDGDDSTIDHPDYSNIWERVDWAIDQAAANDLLIIVNMHHYDAIHEDPLVERDRYLAMWTQIAERYSDAGEHVVFELLNEPHQTFDAEPELWNQFSADALAIVRMTNPTRPVLIGPVGYNSVDRLTDLSLPDDPNLIATVHVYEPFSFTHQGATWSEPVPPVGVAWNPDAASFPVGVADYSWETTVSTAEGNLLVDYDGIWAGFSLDYQRPAGLTEVSFTVRGRANLQLLCREPNDATTSIAAVQTSSDASSYTYDLRGCSSESTGIFLQTTEPNPDQLIFESLVLCSDRGCEEMVNTAAGVLDAIIERAAQWAADNGVPLHLGEFGAYGAEGEAPLADRAAWTRVVQESATSRGVSTAYWEFHSGFGAWDPETGEWIGELLTALVG